jgi:hypothetical protein
MTMREGRRRAVAILPPMRARGIAAVLAAALLVGACGDSGDSGSAKPTADAGKTAATTTEPANTSTSKSKSATPGAKATKAVVVAKGDKACRTAKTKRSRLDRVGSAADQIAALASQTGDKRIAKYVGVLNNELGLLRRLSYARKQKQSGQVSFLLAALAKQRHRARVLAREYGFRSCGSG